MVWTPDGIVSYCFAQNSAPITGVHTSQTGIGRDDNSDDKLHNGPRVGDASGCPTSFEMLLASCSKLPAFLDDATAYFYPIEI